MVGDGDKKWERIKSRWNFKRAWWMKHLLVGYEVNRKKQSVWNRGATCPVAAHCWVRQCRRWVGHWHASSRQTAAQVRLSPRACDVANATRLYCCCCSCSSCCCCCRVPSTASFIALYLKAIDVQSHNGRRRSTYLYNIRSTNYGACVRVSTRRR